MLTEMQRGRASLCAATRSYIEWIRGRLEARGELAFQRLLRDEADAARERFRARAVHLRQPETAAMVWVGLSMWLGHAQEIGAISREGADAVPSNRPPNRS
jgi:hypothetical protein